MKRIRSIFPSHHKAYPWVALLAALIMLGRCAATVGVFNHTTDEPAHIAAAVTLYDGHKILYMVEHPPLQRLIVGGVLRLAGVTFPAARELDGEVQSRSASNAVGAQILFHGNLPYWKVLIIARLTNLIFPAAALLFLYKLGRYLANPRVAMLAVVFFSFDPSLLAHSGLAGTDVAAAAGFLLATYYGLRWVVKPTWQRTAMAGLALGLGLSCKFTCMFIVPALGVLVILRSVRKARRKKGMFFSGWPSFAKIGAVVVSSLFVLWAAYLFDIGKLSNQALFENERGWVSMNPHIKEANIPMPSMVLGNLFLFTLSRHGFRCYLNGHVAMSGGWYYFAETIAIKSPIGMLLAVGAGVIVFLLCRKRHPWVVLAILLPPSILFLVSSAGKLQIGIRHVIPVLPFLYLFAAYQLQRGLGLVVLLAMMILACIETAAIHPDYLSFFNEMVGGPENGTKYLADSNIDWGQDVQRLSEYLHAQKKPYTIRVSGACVDELLKFLKLEPQSPPFEPKGFLGAMFKEEARRYGVDMGLVIDPPRGLLAISNDVKVRLEDIRLNKDGTFELPPDYSWLKHYPMVKRIGRSIEVYDLSNGPTR